MYVKASHSHCGQQLLV